MDEVQTSLTPFPSQGGRRLDWRLPRGDVNRQEQSNDRGLHPYPGEVCRVARPPRLPIPASSTPGR